MAPELIRETKAVQRFHLRLNKYMHALWLIWSFEHNGWWCPHERGYTSDLNRAGTYSFEKAFDIVTHANTQFRMKYAEGDANAMPNEVMIPFI